MVTSTNEKENIIYSPINKLNEKSIEKLPIIGIRHWQVLLLFILLFTAFGLRVILSVAIVAMTDPHASSNSDVSTYNWKDKGAILSAFFWGYIWTQIVAGYVANRFGAKWFLIVTILIQSLLGILTPVTAEYLGSRGMCISRALQGACQGFLYPSITHQLSQWVPHEERSRLGSFVLSGSPFGTVLAMPIAGLIASSKYGWPFVFYIYGGLGLSWCLLFYIFGSDRPAAHPGISRNEKKFIESSLGHTNKKLPHTVPWKHILKSLPVWAIFVVQLGHNYSYYTLLTQIPTYMSHVMNFNIKDNSLLSALPYLTLWLLTFVVGYISDTIVNKNFVSVSTARKLFNTIGCLITALSLIALGFTRADQTTQAVVLLVLAVSANAACMSGWAINHIDLSPNYAGTLMGLTNGLSHVSAIFAPLTVQFFVTDESNPEQWKNIFIFAAGIIFAVAIFFIIFGSGKVQRWNTMREDQKDENELNEMLEQK